MSVLSGNSNTNLSTILYGTNKTVQEVYFGNALVWSAQSTSFSFSPTTLYNLSNGGGSVDITFTPGISDYVAGTWPAWVSSVTPTVVSGVTTKITVTYGENSSTSTRDGNLTFFAGGENRTVPMSQQAADVTVTSELNFAGVGGTQKIYITGSFSSWRINSAPLWVDYASSTGSTSPIDITADSNTGSSRGGTISLTVDGHLYSVGVIQAAIEVHKFKINPTPSNATVLIDGQQRTNNEAYFAPTTVIPWRVSATGYETKTGQLTMGYTDYTMDVTLVAATYTLSVSPTSREFDYDEYNSSNGKSISITSNQSWTISVPTGFAISRSTSGSGNATFNVYPTSYNSGTTNKTGTLTITGNDSQFVNVQLTQKALILTIDPTELNVSASGGSYSVSVGDPNNYGWTISSNQSWCSVEPSSGTGNATVAVGIGMNTSSSRSATITLASSTGDGTNLTCSVAQSAAQAITFDPPSVSFDGAGSEEVIGINGTFDWWEVTSWPNWCTCEMTTGQSNNPILIEAGANTGSTTRTGTLVVEVDGVAYQLALSQISASAVTYNFIVSASPSGCTVLINDSVRTNNTFACPAGTEVRWSVSKTGYVTQSGTYTMTAANHTETVTLVAATLTVSTLSGTNSLTFDYDKYGWATGSQYVIVNSNQSWTMTTTGVFRIGSSGATTINGTAGNNSYDIFPASANTGSSARTGTLTVTGTYGGTATINLTQNYNTDALQSLSIDGPDTLDIQDTSAYTVSYTPSGTSQTAVEWSVSGNANGELMDMGGYDAYVIYPTNNASVGDTVTVTVTSTVVSGKSASKSVTIVDELGPAVEPIDSVTISAVSGVTQGNTVYTQAVFSATVLPSTAEDKSVTWSLAKHPYGSASDLNKCSISTDSLGRCVFTVLSSATYPCWAYIVATSNADPSVSDQFEVVFMNRT